MNLKDAREKNQLDQFIKEHPSEGNKSIFDKLFAAMTIMKPKASEENDQE